MLSCDYPIENNRLTQTPVCLAKKIIVGIIIYIFDLVIRHEDLNSPYSLRNLSLLFLFLSLYLFCIFSLVVFIDLKSTLNYKYI